VLTEVKDVEIVRKIHRCVVNTVVGWLRVLGSYWCLYVVLFGSRLHQLVNELNLDNIKMHGTNVGKNIGPLCSTAYKDLFLNFISVFNQLDAKNLSHIKFYFIPLHVSSTCAHHQDVKIAFHSLWYHHTYRCDDTRGCVMQF